MKKQIQEFFLSDATLIFAEAFSLLFSIFIIAYDFSYIEIKIAYVKVLKVIILGMLSFTSVLSYIKHDKNVMKCAIGGLLASLSFVFLDDGLIVDNIIISIKNIVIFVLIIALFISHVLINSKHHSSPTMIAFNQIIMILLVVAYLFDVIYIGISDSSLIFAKILDLLFHLSILLIIVCIESKLDAYRLKKEEQI